MSKIFSPFADGSIVEPKDFVGRRDIIEKFEPYLKDSINGNPNYFLITGEYYIGKSSFLKYLSFHAKEKYKIISCSWLIENTIEEKIQKLQDAKQNLAEQIISGDMGQLGSMSREDILELL